MGMDVGKGLGMLWLKGLDGGEVVERWVRGGEEGGTASDEQHLPA